VCAFVALVIGLALPMAAMTQPAASASPSSTTSTAGTTSESHTAPSDTDSFVTALYEDLLDRSPDSAGLATWDGALAGGLSPEQVAFDIATSAEYRIDLVTGYYEHFLDRAPDAAGLATWTGLLAGGSSDEQVIADILGSAEFEGEAGGTSQGVVTAVYEDLLGRSPDSAGLATWDGALAGGLSPEQVAFDIATSAEYRIDLVTGYYEHFLDRAPDAAGLATWTGLLAGGSSDEQVIADILGSAEFEGVQHSGDLTLTTSDNDGGNSVTHTTGSAAAGGSITYTVVVHNAGTSTATGVGVSDPLAANPDTSDDTFTAAESGGATGFTTSGTGSIDATGNLPADSSVTYTVTAEISSSATGTLSNTATLTPPAGTTNTGNDSATDSDTLTSKADLVITPTVNNSSPAEDTNVIFTATVADDGPSDATGVAVSDLLPSGLTFVSDTVGTGTYDASTGVWSIGDLANGATDTLTVTAEVVSTGSFTNTATVSSATEDTNATTSVSSTVTTPSAPAVTPEADLVITPTVNNSSPPADTDVTFTVTAANDGPFSATGVDVADLLPSGLSFVSDSATAGTYDSTTGVWTIGSLANGATDTLTVTAEVVSSGSFTNTATVSSSTEDTNATTSASVTVATPTFDLTVTMTDNNDGSSVPGDSITYTLVVVNAGLTTATGIGVTDPLTTNPNLIGDGYTAAVTSGSASGFSASGTGNVDDTALNLAAGASVTYNIAAVLSPSATGTLSNMATLTPPSGTTNTGNGSATDSDTLTPEADLVITETVNNSSPPDDSEVNFTVTVIDHGPSDATGVVVNDLLPSGLIFENDTVGAGTYDPGTGVWSIGDLANGATDTLTVTAEVVSLGSITNTATVSSTTADSNTTTSASSTVTPPTVDLTVTVTNNSGGAVGSGSDIIYTVVVHNAGSSTATGVGVIDLLASNPNVTSDTFTAAESGGAIGFAASGTGSIGAGGDATGNLPAGASVTYSITAEIPLSAAGTLSNTAFVDPPAGTTNTGNDSATDTDPIFAV
jgi:large repetitive protein